jgi:hypothetical protein
MNENINMDSTITDSMNASYDIWAGAAWFKTTIYQHLQSFDLLIHLHLFPSVYVLFIYNSRTL